MQNTTGKPRISDHSNRLNTDIIAAQTKQYIKSATDYEPPKSRLTTNIK